MTDSVFAEFHGTKPERDELLAAAARNCECQHNALGQRTSTCSAHAMLQDQPTLDHLIYTRRRASTLKAEESTTQRHEEGG